jgi:hypothetical protein
MHGCSIPSCQHASTPCAQDEFPHSTYSYTYSKNEWDSRTAFLNPYTKAVEAVASSLVLLTNDHEMKLARTLASKGGHMVTNGSPQTRSWIQMSVDSPLPPIAENENSIAWRALHSQLFTPLMLNRYAGNPRDLDPRYNHSSIYPHDNTLRTQCVVF